jgi:Na+/H+-dicarboxylate symporter
LEYRNIVAFVLPLGYSFNLDGPRFTCRWRACLGAATGGRCSGQQLVMMLTLMLASKGVAGARAASSLTATLTQFDPPSSSRAARHRSIMDMGRTAVNDGKLYGRRGCRSLGRRAR